MNYTMQDIQIRQLINIFLVITLVLTNLATPYGNSALAQSSLRQKATSQTEEARQDLAAALAGPERPTEVLSGSRIGPKTSSTGMVVEIHKMGMGSYIKGISCIKGYLDALSRRLRMDEELLGVLKKDSRDKELLEEMIEKAQERRIELREAELQIRKLSYKMEKQSLRAFVGALRILSPFQKEAVFMAGEKMKPYPDIEFDPDMVLFIPEPSWLSKMFGLRGAENITVISDGRETAEILLIRAGEKSLEENVGDILHGAVHRCFTPGRKIIMQKHPELLPFYDILEEAMTEATVVEISGDLENVPGPDPGEYYLYERELLRVMIEKLGGGAERAIKQFLHGRPEPLKGLLGPLWERFISITNRVDVTEQDLAYDAALWMMFLYLPKPDAEAKLDAGTILLDALNEMDFEYIDEIGIKRFPQLWPKEFNECKKKAAMRVIRDILKAERVDLKTAKADFQDRFCQYTIEGAKSQVIDGALKEFIDGFGGELPPAPDTMKSSSSGKVIVDEKYIQDSGYNIIGGAANRRLSKRLNNLTGINGLAHQAAVYSPLHDMGRHEPISLEFALSAAEQIKELADRFKPQHKNSIRILVIGSGTGIDALCAFHHAKFVEQFESVLLRAIDIQEEAVRNTKFNFMLRLPGSRFKGESLQFDGDGLEDDSIVVKRVPEGGEFDGLEEEYDLILFNAPDAVSLEGPYETRVETNQFVFKAILENIREHLSDDGVALVRNLRSILDAQPDRGRNTRLIPDGLDVSFAGSGIGFSLKPSSWAIFKLTLDGTRQRGRRPTDTNSTGGLRPSSRIRTLQDAEKAIGQSA